MRSLADLWKHGTPDEKRFVRTLLLAYSHGRNVTAREWRLAERDWARAVALHDARGEPDPEFAAVNYLLMVIVTDRAIGD